LAVVRKNVFQVGVEALLDGRAAGLEILLEPVGGRLGAIVLGLVGLSRLGGAAVVIGRPLEQRIALKLRFNIGRQVQAGELQQLDGLHQLRRHDERLALPHFKFLRERHRGVLTGPVLAYPVLGPVYTGSCRLSLTASTDTALFLREKTICLPESPRLAIFWAYSTRPQPQSRNSWPR